MAAEYASTPAEVYGTEYMSRDYLGNVRLISGATTACHDYLPFGEEIPSTWARSGVACFEASDGITRRFTGKERDAETGLDWFETRYMSSAQGRFTSPDEPFAGFDQHDPQSFNLYSYGRNNPLKYTEPDGHDVQICIPGSDCFNLTEAQYKNLYNQQNGQQGIGLPGGTFPGGNITCGGQNCGTARYFEPSMTDDTINLAITFDGARGFLAGVRRFSAACGICSPGMRRKKVG